MKCQVLCALCMVKKIDIQLLLNVYFGQTGFEPAWNRKSVRKRAATAGRFRIIEKKATIKRFQTFEKKQNRKDIGQTGFEPAWNRKSVRKRAATAGRFRIIEKKATIKRFQTFEKKQNRKDIGQTGFEPATSTSRTSRATNCAIARKKKVFRTLRTSLEATSTSRTG